MILDRRTHHWQHIVVLTIVFVSCMSAGPYHEKIDYMFPLPGSAMLPPKTTIIIRPQAEFLSSIDTIESFIKVHNTAGPVSGRVFWAADERTIIFQPHTTLPRGDTIHVFLQTSLFADADYDFTFTVANNATQPQPLMGNSAPHEPGIIMDNGRQKARLINGVSVPADFPDIETAAYAPSADGKIFFATRSCDPGYGMYIIICNKDGTPYFYRRIQDKYGINNFDLQPNGSLSFFLNEPRHHCIMDEQYSVIDTIKAGHGYITDNHEFVLLKNGHALLIAEEILWFDLSDTLDGGQESVRVLGNHLQELDADDNVIFEWRCWDHFRIIDAVTGDLQAKYIDYVHMNSIAVDFDGHLILSSRHLSEVTKINRNTGEIMWRLGGKHNQFTFINGAEPPSCQHDAQPVPDESNHYTFFDNGNQKNPRISQAVQVVVDPVAKTVSRVWNFRYTPDRFIKGKGCVQRLPNGNTFIDWTDMPPVAGTEVNSDGNLVYEFYAHGVSSYRSRHYQWHSVAPRPYLIVENLGSVVQLLYNKFGDETVSSYNIYQAVNDEPFNLIAATTRPMFMLENLENRATHTFRISALLENGQESEFSNTETIFVDYVEPGQNLVKNGDFVSDEFWALQSQSGGDAQGAIDEMGQYKIDIAAAGSELGSIQLSQDNLTLINGKQYQLEFDAYADNNRVIEPVLTSLINPDFNYSETGVVALSKRMQHFVFQFYMQHASDTAARLLFNCGQFEDTIYLDNIILKEIVTASALEFARQKRVSVSLGNYPNPFNASTIIHFTLATGEPVRLQIYNSAGQQVALLIDEYQSAGEHQVVCDATTLASGIYFYRLSGRDWRKTRKFAIMH